MSGNALEVIPAALPAPSPATNFLPVMSLGEAKGRRDLFVQYVKEIMVDGIDYGAVPGSTKPTLMKPGAEKLCTLFGLVPSFELVERIEDWTGKDHDGEPFFYYFYKCRLWRGGQQCQGEGDGSCNSMEVKYRYRWVQESDIPEALRGKKLKTKGGRRSEFVFAIEKAETTGQYGKPLEHWQAFRQAIENGTATAIKKKAGKAGKEYDAWEIDATLYRIPNDDIADQVNTIQKMAQKRAYVASTLVATNASEFFTQDIEEMDGGHEVVTGAPIAGGQTAAEAADKAPVPAGGHATAASDPAPTATAEKPTATEKQLQKALDEQAKTLFKQVVDLFAAEPVIAPKVAIEEVSDFLRKVLCVTDLKEVDSFSKVEKLKIVMQEEARQKGAGRKMVQGFASDYRKQVAAAAAGKFVDDIGDGPEDPQPEVLPASTPVPAAATPAGNGGAYGELTMRYMAICKRVGMKDGLKIVNDYLQQQVGAFDVTTCKDEVRRGQYAAIFEALERMPGTSLRAFLLEKPVDTVHTGGGK